MGGVRVISRGHRRDTVYTVTDAHRPMSEDINYRQRRYLISMGIRTMCLLAAHDATATGTQVGPAPERTSRKEISGHSREIGS